jgi:DNA-binding Lrp family transcriptional regulator
MLSYVLVTCQPGSEEGVISEIRTIPEVVEVNGTMGKYDIIVKLSAENPDKMELAVAQIRKIGIIDSHTMPVLYGQGGTIDKEIILS